MTDGIDPVRPKGHGDAEGWFEPSEWIAAVQSIAERLTDVLDRAGLARVVREELFTGFDAAAIVLAEATEDDPGFSPLLVDGVRQETQSALSDLDEPEAAWMGVVDAVMDRRPLFWSSLADRDEESPAFSGQPSRARSWAVLPLVVHGDLIGALSIGWAEERLFDESARTILTVIAHQCAVALARIQLEQVRRAERATLELLSEGTRYMVSALEPERVIDALVQLAVPRLAPWCGVYVAEGTMLRRVAIRISGDRRLSAELRDDGGLSVHAPQPLARAFRSGETVVVSIEDSMVRAVYRADQAERILGRGGEWMAMAVPIQAGGRVIGVLSLVSNGWGSGPPDDVRFAAEGLAARAGVALSNARRFEEERDTAALLTGAILPSRLPDVPGYELAARYLPAGSRVAGDWYDAAHLPTGDYLVGIGDVGGHGIVAASLMSQLRHCARGFAMMGYSPGSILDALRTVIADQEDCFATASYALLDPARHTLQWSAAGHLPPLGIHEDAADYLDQVPAAPLGVVGAGPSRQHRTVLESTGDGLVLVTDGVVESRHRGIDEGMERLRQLVETNVTASAEDLVDLVADDLCKMPEDDCCIVVLRRR